MIEIAEEVAAAILLGPGKVPGRKGSAGNTGRGIMVDRPPEARVFCRAVFDNRPAVIGARAAFVDFFGDSADVIDEDTSCVGLHG